MKLQAIRRSAMVLVEFLTMLYLVAVPLAFVFTDQIGGHDGARAAEVGLLTCASLWSIAAAIGVTVRLKWDALAIAAGAFIVCAPLIAMHSPDVQWAFRELALFAGLAALAMCVALLRAQSLDRLAWAAVLAMVVYNALLLLVAIASISLGQWPDPGNLAPGYDNFRFFNHVQTVALSLLAGIALAAPTRVLRNLAQFGLITGLALLMHAGGRASLIGLLLAPAISFACLGQPGRHIASQMARSIVVALLLYGAIFVALAWLCDASAPVAQVLRLNSLTTDGSRMSLWRDAWHAIESEPLWGIGPMQFAAARHANPVGAHPHNLLLQIAAEWGLPVAALMAAAVVTGLRSLRSTVRAAPDSWRGEDWTLTDPKLGAALFMGCIAALIDAQFSGNAVMPVPQVWLAVLIGWAIAFRRNCRTSATLLTEHAMHTPRRVHLLPLAVLVAALNTWNARLTYSDLSRLQAILNNAATLAAGHKTTPRYWSNGRF